MDEEQALDLIRPLADGVLPTTGEELPVDSPLQHPHIVRALYLAVQALEVQALRRTRQRRLPENAGKPWSVEEDRRMERAFDGGDSVSRLAETHRRTPAAIQARLVKLGKLDA